MAALRELVAKLGFKVDDRGAQQFTKTLDGLKQSINTLAVAKLNQWAVSLEQAFEKTNRQLELIAKSDGFKKIQDAVGGNKSGIFDQTQLRQAGVEFQKITNDAELFGKTLQATKEYATIVSQTPAELSRGFAEFVASGATGQMQELGLVTQQQLERLRLSGREYGKWTTHARKVELMNILTANAGRRQELYSKSLKNSDVQFSMLMGNFRKFGRSIGSFLAPALARVLGHVNDLFTKFQNSPLAQTAAKFIAITAAVTGIGAAILTVAKVAMLFLSPLILKIAIISAVATAAFLIIEDIYTYLTDPLADTWIGALIGKFPILGTIINGIRDSIKWLIDSISNVGVFQTFLDILTKLGELTFDGISAGFSAALDAVTSAISGFFKMPVVSKLMDWWLGEDRKGGFLKDLLMPDKGKPDPVSNQAAGGGGSKVDSQITVNVGGSNASPEEIKGAVVGAVNDSYLGTVMRYIKTADNMATGGP